MCEKCGGQGHVFNTAKGVYERCSCIKEEIKKQKFGVFYSPNILAASQLEKLVGTDCVIEAPLSALRPHVSCVMTKVMDKSIVAVDAYRFLDIFLQRDEEFETQSDAIDKDLLIVLLGFGDPRNKYLPELLLQVLGRREVLRLPTWIVLGVGMDQVGMKYGADLATKLSGFKRVKMND